MTKYVPPLLNTISPNPAPKLKRAACGFQKSGITSRGVAPRDAYASLRVRGVRGAPPQTGARGAPPSWAGSHRGARVVGGVFAAPGAAPGGRRHLWRH